MYRKLVLYKEAGVKEYWVVNPKEKSIEVTVKKDKGYNSVSCKASDTLFSTVLKGFELKLETLFSRMLEE